MSPEAGGTLNYTLILSPQEQGQSGDFPCTCGRGDQDAWVEWSGNEIFETNPEVSGIAWASEGSACDNHLHIK